MDHHRHHHGRSDDNAARRLHHPPPPHVPPPVVTHHAPPPPVVSHHAPHPPVVTHHHAPPPPPVVTHHHAPPPPPVVTHHVPVVTHHVPSPPVVVIHHGNSLAELMRNPTVRIFTKAGENHSLAIRGDKVVLARTDTHDLHQHWIKDTRHSSSIRDEEGHPAFALVNKATGEAIKHSFGAKQPVRLIKYNPDYLDESVLWTESKDLGDGFRCIRMVNNILLNFDAFHGDKQHGGVHDGTVIQTWEWLTGDNQRWKILPY